MAGAGSIRIILGMRTVGDDKDLHVLKQPAPGPEAIPLVPLDLIGCLPDGHAPALELHVDQGQAVTRMVTS